ncbi:collagenase [Thalassotalea fusca]
MKFNKVVAASCVLLASTSVNAQHLSTPPQQAIAIEKHDHGIPTEKDNRAPTPQRADNGHQDLAKHNPDIRHLKKLSKSQSTTSAAITCDVTTFATSDSNALISELKAQGPSCINELFNASSSVQVSAFDSNNMYAVAKHVKDLSKNYAGGGDQDIEGMFLYLRAGFFSAFYNDDLSHASWVAPAVKEAIDEFVANANFYQDNDAHGKTLGEVIIAMDSSEQQDAYLPVVKEWLSRWNQSYASKWNMRSAVNGIFTILFRGQWNDNFITLVQNDTELVNLLKDFSLKSWMIDSDSEYLIANAARELGRLKQYTNGSIQPAVNTALSAIFNSSYQSYGFGDAVWLGAADTASYHGDCNDFGICGYKEELESQVLSQVHVCSPTIKIRSQELTATQQNSACAKMAAEETYFHDRLETNNQAVADDNNSQLQVNIFNSSTDYGKYAGHIFGINTNNGGMYLEGDPSNPSNVPNFVAYEANYAEPDHYVWNLEHEYVHYLDGRFDLYGDFNAPTEAIVWWTEGVAEYVSKQNDNQAAIDTISDGSTFTLSAVFDTTYDGFDQDRIYRWGYLAVRFMFERHFSEVKAMLAETRAGNWSAYKARMNTWASNYGNEFTTWTQELANGTPDNVAPTALANGPYNAALNTDINFSSAGSSDSDGSIVSYDWNFGDGGSSTEANPTYQYNNAGSYTATLTVTDDGGLTATSNAAVTITDNSGNSLQNGVSLAIAGDQNSETIYTLTVPEGASELSFQIAGGTGDADLYVMYGQAPTRTEFDCRPYKTGNEETCTITTVQAGTYYVMVRGYNSYETNLLASYRTGQVPDACATQGSRTNGRVEADTPICLGDSGPMWFSVADISGHSSIAITMGNGTGNFDIEFSNAGWPNGSNHHDSSYNSDNSECIYVANLNEYWGYIKISGAGAGASMVVDFDTAGCR